MEQEKRRYSEQEAYGKLAARCAVREMCCHDVRRAMRMWELPEGAMEHIVERLVKERFVDEGRYARAFAKDKFAYNHWGRVRIERELKLRGISRKHIEEALTEIGEEDSLEALRDIVRKKRPTLKGRSEYEVRGKLINFALRRGFEMDDIVKVVGHLDEV